MFGCRRASRFVYSVLRVFGPSGLRSTRYYDYKSIVELMYQLNRLGDFRSYVPLNKKCVKPIKGVKGFNGRLKWET